MTDYYDLGTYSRKITTSSDEGQMWFDRGLVWCFGYNHEEAIKCFEKVLDFDADCAMAHWGIAYAAGPNYNKPWEMFDPNDKAASLEKAFKATAAANAAAKGASAMEQALIGALPQRYPQMTPEEDQKPWNDAYAKAMQEVYQQFPDDLEVVTFYAEAMMNRTPWKLWDLQTGGYAEDASTEELVRVMDKAFAEQGVTGAYEHPGLLHLYVHTMEMSPHPEKALKAGDALRHLVPDAGHLGHMPTHIDVLCGYYRAVVDGNNSAIIADREFLAREGAMNFYSAYRIHNYHFKLYGAMFLGQYQPAIEAAEELIATVPVELLKMESPPMADFLEGYLAMKQHVLVRFGKWDEIIAQVLPDDPELYCVTTAMIHYAKTVAHAASNDIAAAEAERELFLAAQARVPKNRWVHNNRCDYILAIAEQMVEGEIEYRKGNYDVAFNHLRLSIEKDDALPYDEPWGWMQPPRHALGALLSEQGHYEEAEAAYRADLGLDNTLSRASQHPDNVWALHGLHECLVQRGETAEAAIIKQRLDLASARADVPITASCFCRLEVAA